MTSSTTCTARGCGRPVADQAYLCSACAAVLTRDVGRVADLRAALDDALARRTRLDRPPTPPPASPVVPVDPVLGPVCRRCGHSSCEAARSPSRRRPPETLRVQPLPVDLDAAGQILELRRVLLGWADWVAAERGLARPLDTWKALGSWLADQVEWLRHHPEGPRAADEIGRVVVRVMRFVDRPPSRWYAGPCTTPFLDEDGLLVECDADLYPESGAVQFTCPACRAVHDVEHRREWLLDQAQDRLAHAELIARAVTMLDQRVTSAQVRGWAHRGRLLAKSRDAQGRPLYRIGDVLELVREDVSAGRRATLDRRRANA